MDPESRLAAAAAKQDPARDRARREDAERQELLAGAAARRAPARPAVDDPADREAAIQQARRTHADTTASALRAQKIAEDTRETAVATNAALQQQRRVLEGAVDDLDGVRVQAKAAKGLAADIKSWCRCFCDCFCCSKKPARPVRGRPAAQGADAAKRNAEERKAREKEEKRAAADRAKHGGDPEVPWHAPRHDAHLGALAADRLRQAQQDGAFSPEDVEVLEQETAKQEKALDAVAAAVDDLKHLARHMGEELDGQMPLVDEAVRKNEQAREGIRSIRL